MSRKQKERKPCPYCGVILHRTDTKFCSKKCSARFRVGKRHNDKLIIEDYHLRLPLIDISKKYNISIVTLFRILKDNGIENRGQFIDFKNKRFDKLLVLESVNNSASNGKHMVWICKCDCGNIEKVLSSTLSSCKKLACYTCTKKKHRENKNGFPTFLWTQMVIVGARSRKKDVLVTKEYCYNLLEQQEFKCALTGQPIHLSNNSVDHKKGLTTASVDRIDSSKGYVEGNIQWVHKNVNKMKWDLPQEEFISICEQVVKNKRNF